MVHSPIAIGHTSGRSDVPISASTSPSESSTPDENISGEEDHGQPASTSPEATRLSELALSQLSVNTASSNMVQSVSASGQYQDSSSSADPSVQRSFSTEAGPDARSYPTHSNLTYGTDVGHGTRMPSSLPTSHHSPHQRQLGISHPQSHNLSNAPGAYSYESYHQAPIQTPYTSEDWNVLGTTPQSAMQPAMPGHSNPGPRPELHASYDGGSPLTDFTVSNGYGPSHTQAASNYAAATHSMGGRDHATPYSPSTSSTMYPPPNYPPPTGNYTAGYPAVDVSGSPNQHIPRVFPQAINPALYENRVPYSPSAAGQIQSHLAYSGQDNSYDGVYPSQPESY
ncbi:hypothetical protein HGRIS_010070 [Hohenbuehelia grisea]|uniref:Uncharacterized protein n=1 Tax=Hohenbuehelia grisea TaxID=104357 RepID=A0ABR3J3Q8_9AGAR